jgi:hypothetical protein
VLSPFADSTSDTGTETPPPEKRLVRGPVGWLLGADLISKIGKVLRHRADPRHWMPFRPGEVHDERSAAARGERIEITRTAAERGDPAVQPAKSLPETDVWFDYVADSGDDNDAMYAIAYASMVGFVAPSGGLSTATWKRSEPTRLTVAPAGGGALPRGQFLFFGGDTAYHVADAAALRARVEVPFRWAFDDAKSLKHVAPGASVNAVTRRVYGIPGNHDWYDNLKGFAQVFRIAARSTSGQPAPTGPIVLPELAPVQLASYVAIQLPYGWQLWGLDVDDSLGDQQRTYFESLRDLSPERLIVATASPAYVFGARLMKEGHCGAHNNELGAAAGVSSYRQLIRFHVHAEGLTGYVIAARTQGAAPAARTGGTALIFELIDVFTIAAPTPTRPVGPPP